MNTTMPAFKIRGSIADSAPIGVTAELTPTNGTDGQGYGATRMKNELTHEGRVRLVSTEPKLEGAFLQIVGDVTLFIRGDSNGDETVDVSDVITTLGFIFRGTAAPHCFDAADANDDGKLDVSDPIYTLNFLFRRGDALPPPTETPGLDPTPDSRTCRRLEL